ncbi:MAG: TetR/AcrR family transcriptional regulator [Lachnospiraceae bacterium]|nr:TetR/AcrR family transcriptional regulator [Lachnospiraceae bacterium]
MPAPKRITKEFVLSAALQVVRKHGFDALNARSIAKELRCSTQPIYVEFANMEELKNLVVDEIIACHKTKVEAALQKLEKEAYRAYGLGFVQFARDEKELFRFLYLNAEDGGKIRDDIFLEQIIENIQREYGYTEETAKKFHSDMHNYTYGIAMLANTGYRNYSDEEIKELLHREFMALTSIYGIPLLFLQKKRQYQNAPRMMPEQEE